MGTIARVGDPGPGEGGSSTAERLALGLGLGGGAVLLGVAALLFQSAGALGRGQLAERATAEAALVSAAWRGLTTDSSAWFGAGEPGARVATGDRSIQPARLDPVDLGDDAMAFQVLLDRARRARVAGEDPDAARRDLEAARDLARGPVLRATVDLERLRLDASVGGDLAVGFEDFWGAADPRVAVDGLPAVAVAFLTAAPALGTGGRGEAARIAAWIDAGELALPAAAVRWREDRGSGPVLETEPRVVSLLDALVAAADGDPVLRSAADRLLVRARAAALSDRLVAAGWSAGEALAFVSDLGGFWIVDAGDLSAARARWCSARDLAGRLREEVARVAVEPSPLAIGLGPADASMGEAVGAPIRLAGLPVEGQLRHPDPARLAASGGGRVRATALALSVLALLTLAAGWTTRSSLARQRRLGALRSRWVAAVSHELRTPVAALSLAAGRLERTRIERPDRLARYHEIIRSEAERLERLVAQVMDIARIERGRMPALRLEAVDPTATLEATVGRARALLADRGLQLDAERGALPDRCVLDSLALGRAIENLVENAAHHSGGSRVLLRWSSSEGELVVEVRDDGRGLPTDERLFEPFERGDESDTVRGVGLGLGIARELARAHGGDLVALAEPDGPWVGAGFRLTVPLRAAPRADDAGPEEATA